MAFSLTRAIQADTFVKGAFVMGQLNVDKKCVLPITYHLRASDFTTSVDADAVAKTEKKIRPNPALDHLLVPTTERYSITSLLGNTVQEGISNGNKIDVSALLPGTYLLHDSYGKAFKFVKE